MISTLPRTQTVDISGERVASGRGHGTLEILEVVKTFEKADIAGCIMGVSALMYFGARRCWDICVPTERFNDALYLIRSNPLSDICMEVSPADTPDISLFDTYPHFKRLGYKNVFFHVITSEAAQIPCNTSNFEWRWTGLPYPKLHLFVQSAIDTYDNVALVDVIDGMDLSEEWGFANLDLSYKSDTSWSKLAIERLEKVSPTTIFNKIPFNPCDRKALWQSNVARKRTRGGWKYPKELYATRFRRHGSQDPRAKYREHV